MFIQRKIVTLFNVTIFIMFEKTIFIVGCKKNCIFQKSIHEYYLSRLFFYRLI